MGDFICQREELLEWIPKGLFLFPSVLFLGELAQDDKIVEAVVPQGKESHHLPFHALPFPLVEILPWFITVHHGADLSQVSSHSHLPAPLPQGVGFILPLLWTFPQEQEQGGTVVWPKVSVLVFDVTLSEESAQITGPNSWSFDLEAKVGRVRPTGSGA